jgi:uncharacterized protein (DUF1800 family)
MASILRLLGLKADASSGRAVSARKKRKRKRKAQAKCRPTARKKTPQAKPGGRKSIKKSPAKRKGKPNAHCRPKPKPKAKPKPHLGPSSGQPAPVGVPLPPAGQPPATPPVQPTPPESPVTSPIAMYDGPFGHDQATRLLYRAGFGPRPGDAARLSAMGLGEAIKSLTRPSGAATLVGPEPRRKDGTPWVFSPADIYVEDAHYWFDRMMRSDQPLVERMALVFHDWFATNGDGIPQLDMLNQTNLFRKHAFGSFKSLVHDISADHAMIVWLNLNKSVVNRANENYARELMELFTLGVGRGYTEHDIREAARAFTGLAPVEDPVTGALVRYEVVPSKHDQGTKTIFGQTGRFGGEDVARLVVEHPLHASFFVRKLWSYFIPAPPTDAEVASLEALYVSDGHAIRPVLEAILAHPALYTGPPMVKPPVVFVAGMLRTREKFTEGELWALSAAGAGQRLYQPPDVGGWDDSRWLDSNKILGRWQAVTQLMVAQAITEADAPGATPPGETPEQAVESALAFWDRPPLRAAVRELLLQFARTAVPDAPDAWARAQRQNALRHLIAISPDFQVS